MPSLTIKGIPPKVYQRLKESAARNRRSLNQEVIYNLERMAPYTDREAERVLQDLRKFRKRLGGKIYLTEESLRAAKNRGRA